MHEPTGCGHAAMHHGAVPTLLALGFSWRKRALLRQFLAPAAIRFVSRASQVPDGASVAVWASGPFGRLWDDAQHCRRFKRLFVEDGFLRSVGLGADWVRPLSWVVDRRAIYYDASAPSDLEHILEFDEFDAPTLQRASALRRQLVATGLTKYNVGTGTWRRDARVGAKQVVLVVGQVETDASLRLGAPGIASNLELLKAVRSANPDAWLLYKPHPDVLAGLRRQGVLEAQAGRYCDEVVTEVTMGALLGAVDTVHVMTSLAGFESLLRGTEVVCHGQPFYAGWGLTQDLLPLPRRTRRLDIDRLVAGALLRYPVYLSMATGLPCPAEQAVSELLAWRQGSAAGLPLWRRLLRPLLRHA